VKFLMPKSSISLENSCIHKIRNIREVFFWIWSKYLFILLPYALRDVYNSLFLFVFIEEACWNIYNIMHFLIEIVVIRLFIITFFLLKIPRSLNLMNFLISPSTKLTCVNKSFNSLLCFYFSARHLVTPIKDLFPHFYGLSFLLVATLEVFIKFQINMSLSLTYFFSRFSLNKRGSTNWAFSRHRILLHEVI
jgi:hypothetical protein